MGVFSWKTQDTGRSIVNRYSCIKTFPVIMTDDKGNQYREDNYEGYGVFGGKDYYVLLDEMNGGTGDRIAGIERVYRSSDSYIAPSLSECGDYFDGEPPEDCPSQGMPIVIY